MSTDREYRFTAEHIGNEEGYSIRAFRIRCSMEFARDGTEYFRGGNRVRGWEHASLELEVEPDALKQHMANKGEFNKWVGDMLWDVIHSSMEVIEDNVNPPDEGPAPAPGPGEIPPPEEGRTA